MLTQSYRSVKSKMDWFVLKCLFIFSVICLANGTIEKCIDSTSLGFTRNANETNKVFVDYFTVLPAELKVIILSNLSPDELYEFTQITDFVAYQSLAAQAYGTTHGNVPIFAKGFSLVHKYIQKAPANVITIQGVNKLAAFFKMFNKNVNNLRIDFGSFYKDEIPQLIDAIRENCVETLTRLEMRNTYNNELQFILEMSFPNVEEVAFFNCYSKMETMDLIRVFPNIRRLSAILTYFNDRTWIQQNFVNLTHLNVYIDDRFVREEDLIEIVNVNPNVNSIGMNHYTPNLLRLINSNYPNVVNLGLLGYSYAFTGNFEAVRMKQIERFFFKGSIEHRMPAFITFERLRELQWHCDTRPELNFLKIISENKRTIEQLDMVGTIIEDTHLRRLFNMPQLRRASFTFNSLNTESFSAEKFVKFIESNDKLEKVRLIGAGQTLRQDLMAKFQMSRIPGWLEVFDPYSHENGDIHIVRKRFETENWDDAKRFFYENSF